MIALVSRIAERIRVGRVNRSGEGLRGNGTAGINRSS